MTLWQFDRVCREILVQFSSALGRNSSSSNRCKFLPRGLHSEARQAQVWPHSHACTSVTGSLQLLSGHTARPAPPRAQLLCQLTPERGRVLLESLAQEYFTAVQTKI